MWGPIGPNSKIWPWMSWRIFGLKVELSVFNTCTRLTTKLSFYMYATCEVIVHVCQCRQISLIFVLWIWSRILSWNLGSRTRLDDIAGWFALYKQRIKMCVRACALACCVCLYAGTRSHSHVTNIYKSVAGRDDLGVQTPSYTTGWPSSSQIWWESLRVQVPLSPPDCWYGAFLLHVRPFWLPANSCMTLSSICVFLASCRLWHQHPSDATCL